MPAKPPPKKRAAALDEYRHKRDFKRTPEPGAKKAKTTGRSFVVQEHHARSHHYDFRLEMNGVLVSWAVPKGPPEDFVAKRLAVHVEDHPLEYGKFAGEIPKGNYGAGTVAIWDKGEWDPLERNWRKAFDGGKLKFILRGEKMQGTYLLARMKEEPNWIFRKLDDETHLPGEPVELEKETASFVAPQLARVVPTVPEGKDWLHEIKLDGYRLIAVQRDETLRLFTRNELDWTDRFSDLARQLKKVSKKDFVLDGEAVVFDDKGRSSFGGLQAALQSGDGKAIDFVVFDLLHLDGLNLRDLPLSERLARLEKLVPDEFGRVRHSKIWPAADGNDLFKQACKSGLEGIISKSANARYAEGSRRDWTKSKCRARQEFIICGYTPPKNSCPAFGALVLGSLENGKIVPRGKVGTGFSEDMRRSLLKQLAPLQTSTAPFDFPERQVTWVKPERVVEIEFAEITRDGSIRQGSFVGIREDKTAKEVHLDPIASVKPGSKEMKVAGITISHPERLVFPADQVSKLEVATYYETVGELMLPHVANRPMAVLRAPAGITGQTFFQKSFTTHVPDHVFTKELPDGTSIFYVKTIKGIVSLAQFGVIEFHPWGAPLPTATKPDVLVWDLDPDEAVPWNEVLGAAFLIRDFLAGHGLETQLKTSGGKGLHIMLHLKKNHDWETMRTFSKAVATAVAEMNPKRFTVTSSKAKRKGKIYIDWLRNGEGSTCVAPWSLRARPGAAISRPINWDNLSAATAAGFTIREPVKEPKDWKKITPQTITKALLKELGVV